MNEIRIPSTRPVIRKAERRKSKLRLAICGPTGSGKTMSALLLAFGLGAGKVGLIDTEHGSGDLYAHLGDYDVIALEPPYTVAKYRDAIRAFEDAEYGVIIIDSLSHAWAGEGGLLDKQGQLESSGKYRNSFATWREITPEHNRLIEQILGSPAHVITTLRSKMEWVVEKDDRGKNTVRKVGLAPVQREGLSYEFTVMMDVAENHTACASKDRTTLFDGWCDRISAATGRTLRQWLDSGSEPVRAVAASIAPAPVVHGDEWPDNSTPDLGDFDAPPSAESAPRSRRDKINEAVPLRQPTAKPSTPFGLEDLVLRDVEERLAACAGRDEVEAVVLSNDVCKAGRTLQGNARQRLRDIIEGALARHGEKMHRIDTDNAQR